MFELTFRQTLNMRPVQVLMIAISAAFCLPAAAQVNDPTRPPSAAELAAWQALPSATTTRWQLQSVLISDQRRIAIINGKRAVVGKEIDGAVVTEIEPTHAVIQTDNDTVTLTIRRLGIKGRESE